MSDRDHILGALRPLVKDKSAAEARLLRHQRSTPLAFPSSKEELLERFEQRARASAATVASVDILDAVPAEVARYLAENNLPLSAKRATDTILDLTPWLSIEALEVRAGTISPEDRCAITIAEAGIAETGSLMLVSTRTTPYAMNFLPETLIVLLPASRVVALLEDGFNRWRSSTANVARTFTLMTGPSRTADIEQTLEIGAHGPKRQLIVIVGDR